MKKITKALLVLCGLICVGLGVIRGYFTDITNYTILIISIRLFCQRIRSI